MANKEKELPPASEEFWDAVIHSGSSVINCELCGRVHFAAAPPGDFEVGEFERLMKQHEENPDKYVYHADVDGISWGTLDGKQAVYECQCNLASKYEHFIWNHRNIIAEYLLKRTRLEKEDAIKENKLAEEVAEHVISKYLHTEPR